MGTVHISGALQLPEVLGHCEGEVVAASPRFHAVGLGSPGSGVRSSMMWTCKCVPLGVDSRVNVSEKVHVSACASQSACVRISARVNKHI